MSGMAPIDTFDLAALVKRVVMAGIDGCTDLSEKKQRIMLTRQCGFLSDEETEEWIALGGMVEA